MSNSVENPRKIKNFFINPKFQLKLLTYFIGLFIISTATLYSTSFLFFWKMKQKAQNVGIPDGHVFYRFLSNQKAEFDGLFIGLAVFNFLLLIGTGILISHRIAGPIHKLKEHLSNKNIKTDEFKLRDSDFFQELGPILNNHKDDKSS